MVMSGSGASAFYPVRQLEPWTGYLISLFLHELLERAELGKSIMEEPNSDKGAHNSAPPSNDEAEVAPTANDQVPPSSVSSSEHTHRSHGIVRRLLVFVVLAILVVAGFQFFQRQKTDKAQAARPAPAPAGVLITTATARQGDIGVYESALGTVTPLSTITVKSRVDGQLMSVNYSEGQMVRKGDVLIQIDPRPFQAALLQAQGQYDRDKALLENANVDLNRYTAAYAKKAIQKQLLDTQVALVHQDEGTLKLDQGQVDNAKVQLAYCQITSPISGRVGLRLVDPGNIVHASDTTGMLVITQMQPISVIFSVAEDYLPQIRQQTRRGNRLGVEAFDRSQQKQLGTGTLLTFDNEIDPTTGTIKLKASFPNSDNALFPNQFVNAQLLVDTHRGVTLVPTPAIQRSAQNTFVFVVKPDSTVSMQNVTVGMTHGDTTEVSGLNPGVTIAIDGFDKLQNGAKVIVRKPGDNSGNAGRTSQ
jgi:multidrug efflux system membrane fusion protein